MSICDAGSTVRDVAWRYTEKACTAAVLFGVMRLPGCPFGSAWCLVGEVCRLGRLG